ncbi:MAG TPA: C4-dicarboxylate ABC transporter permease [Rhodospirillaceae bacterium]|nr:C4-dicarboxylate ABC transporter permease [Candidatus Neomarinimicrobiota bacterium]HCX14169.1 C4-dicarboxylate ABC transporter permease [Rhodospirillaceae bacterium]
MNKYIGHATAWLTLGTVLTCFTVVVLRYAFNSGYTWMQEFYVWQHAIVFMVGAGYTSFIRGHVSVDVLYVKMTTRRKAWVDIIGTIVFLIPWLIALAYTTAPLILSSWSIGESSSQPGGMPAVYLLKSVIWVFCALVGLQGLALIARRILFLRGHDIDVGTPHMLMTEDSSNTGRA